MAKIYAVIDSRIDGTGDEFTKEYSTEAEARRAAEREWGYLTDREKAKRSIVVAVSEATEDGEFNFGEYNVITEFKA